MRPRTLLGVVAGTLAAREMVRAPFQNLWLLFLLLVLAWLLTRRGAR